MEPVVETPEDQANSLNDPDRAASDAPAGQTQSASSPQSETKSEAPPQEAAAGGPPEISQSDIDALLQGTGPTDSATSSDAPTSSDDVGVNQSDIDALFGSSDSEPQSAEPETPAEPDQRLDTLGRPFDEAAAMMQAAMDEENAEKEASAKANPPDLGGESFELAEFAGDGAPTIDPKRVTMLSEVKLRVRIQLGRTRMLVEDVLKLGEGSVVELDKLAGDPVDVLINDRLVARGEVLVLNDSFCVRVSEVLSHDPHRITT